MDLRELGTTSPKLEEEFAPNLLQRKKKEKLKFNPPTLHATSDESFFFLPGVEFALFGSLLLEDSGVLQLHRTGDEADLTALLHQASYPPVVVEFLQPRGAQR